MINGSHRWVGIGGYTFQPSELIKVLLPAFYIRWYRDRSEVDLRSFLQFLGLACVPIALVACEPDHGTTALLLVLLVVLLVLSRIRWIYWALPLVLLVGVGSVVAYQIPYVQKRIAAYLHPESDLRGKGHQPHQAKIATGSGQLWGRGLGESLQKLSYLPEARSDYIAAIFAEEMGFVGVLGLIATYLMWTGAGFAIAYRTRNREAFFLATTLTFVVSFQAFLNLGIVSGLLPSKGMTLPFISQGGSSLIVNCVIFFLLLDIYRKSALRI
jgi:cell division protein FtsW